MRYTPNGQAVTSFSVASSRKYTTGAVLAGCGRGRRRPTVHSDRVNGRLTAGGGVAFELPLDFAVRIEAVPIHCGVLQQVLYVYSTSVKGYRVRVTASNNRISGPVPPGGGSLGGHDR